MTLLALQPTRVGPLALRNRIAMSATVTNLARNREITSRAIEYYAARARGGAGLIVTEGMSAHPTSFPNETAPFAFDPALVPGLARLAAAVHDGGAAILGQLWHVGRQALWNPLLVALSPTSERDPLSGTTPQAMTEQQIADVIEGFVVSAENLRRAGFDGVELHGAHGYLLTQFLSPWSNLRSDGWGGSTERRARIVVELIGAIRERCGAGFAVGLKLSAHEFVPGGIDLDEARRIVAHLAAVAPPDYIAVSQGNFSPSLYAHVPDARFEDVPFRELHRGVREAAGGTIPVMALGKVQGVPAAERLLQAGDADLVGLARPFIADPELVAKAARGEEARPCVWCNTCWHLIHTLRPVACFYAPETPESPLAADAPLAPPEPVAPGAGREVHVVGGGPAGLELARVAAARGHSVTVHERGAAVGGRLAVQAAVPGREAMALAVHWLAARAREVGARIELASVGPPPAGRGAPAAGAPAAGAVIVQATGAVPIVAPLPGAAETISLEDAIARLGTLTGAVAIVDEVEDEPVYALAEALARRGVETHLVTRRPTIGRHVSYVSLIGVLRRLDEAGVTLHPLLVPQRAEAGRLLCTHALSGREHDLPPVSLVVRAGPYRPARPLPGATHVVGDAVAPRSLQSLFLDAHALGRSL